MPTYDYDRTASVAVDYDRSKVAALGVGHSFFTAKNLKLHHFRGLLVVTDMTNAGKRGKVVRKLNVSTPIHRDDALSEKILIEAADSITSMDYDQAKSYLEGTLKREGNEKLFTLSESTEKGVDVEPMGTTLKLEKKFEDDTIVRIHSSPHEFRVVNSGVIRAPGKAADGHRMDTMYSSRGKKDGILFYGWLKDNLSKAADMKIQQLIEVWRTLGIHYDSH